MARVDVDDDTIRRYVLWHFRYDPQRRARRNVVVAAFDNQTEFESCLQSLAADNSRRRDAGESVDPREHVGGVVYEPDQLRRAAYGHLIRRMIDHGVDPRPWIDLGDVPSSMSLFGVGGPDAPDPERRRRLAQLMRRGSM